MTTNTLDQIKQAEKEAARTIETAKQEAQTKVAEAMTKGENSLQNVQNQVGPQITEMLEKAKNDIQAVKTKKERQLEQSLSGLNTLDDKTINRAVKAVIKTINK